MLKMFVSSFLFLLDIVLIDSFRINAILVLNSLKPLIVEIFKHSLGHSLIYGLLQDRINLIGIILVIHSVCIATVALVINDGLLNWTDVLGGLVVEHVPLLGASCIQRVVVLLLHANIIKLLCLRMLSIRIITHEVLVEMLEGALCSTGVEARVRIHIVDLIGILILELLIGTANLHWVLVLTA
jgi:hypothetical protein